MGILFSLHKVFYRTVFNYFNISKISSSGVEESQRTSISPFLLTIKPGTVTILYFSLNDLSSLSDELSLST